MLDPIQITITGVAYPDEGLLVDCTWQWGIRPPQQERLRIDAGITDVEDVREAVVQAVLNIAQAEYEVDPFEHALMGEPLTIDFELEEDTFEATRTELATIFMLRKAEAKQRPREIIIHYTDDSTDERIGSPVPPS